MHSWIRFACCALLAGALGAQAATLKVTVENDQGQPLPGTNLQLQGTALGAATDLEGRAVLTGLPLGEHTLLATCLGYDSLGTDFEITALHQTWELSFTLTAARLDLPDLQVDGGRSSGLDLSEARPVERITSEELQALAGGGGVLQALGSSEGVDTKPCALCGSAGIGLQGLDPSYTQVKEDGLALQSGLGSLYGTESMRTQDLESAELSRGSSDALQGGEAIAGSVDLRRAAIGQRDTTRLQLALGDGLRHEAALSIERRDPLGTRLSLNWSAEPQRLDRDGDRLTDSPQHGRLQGRIEQQARAFGIDWKWSLKGLREQRFAGDVDWEERDRGSSTVYGRDIRVSRGEARLDAGWQDPADGAWSASAAWVEHKQDSWYGPTSFDASQHRGLLRLERRSPLAQGELALETGFSWDRYRDNLELGVETARLDRVPYMAGVYTTRLAETLSAQAGLRVEQHEKQGTIPLLRGSLRWVLAPEWSLHLGAGQGYRQITLFSLDKAVHAGFDGVRLARRLEPERSLGLNATLAWERVSAEDVKRFRLRLHATEFRDKAVLAYASETGYTEYSNAPEAYSRGFSLSQEWLRAGGWGARLSANAARVRYLKAENGQERWHEEHMISRWSGSVRLSKDFFARGLQFRGTWKIFGPQKMPAGRAIDESPVWHTTDLSAQQQLGAWSLGLHLENVLDYTQPDSPFLRSEEGELLDSAMIYGPLAGRRVRLTLSTGF